MCLAVYLSQHVLEDHVELRNRPEPWKSVIPYSIAKKGQFYIQLN